MDKNQMNVSGTNGRPWRRPKTQYVNSTFRRSGKSDKTQPHETYSHHADYDLKTVKKRPNYSLSYQLPYKVECSSILVRLQPNGQIVEKKIKSSAAKFSKRRRNTLSKPKMPLAFDYKNKLSTLNYILEYAVAEILEALFAFFFLCIIVLFTL